VSSRGPLLFKDIDTPGLTGLDVYRKLGGYKTAAEVLAGKSPESCIEVVKASGLRGRGGAGFPTGLKWSFVPKDSPKPRYLVCNADESEPGTFKDRELMALNPHLLIEGMIITAFAIGAKVGYIYLRGEFDYIQTIIDRAIDEARGAGIIGKRVLKTDIEFELYTHLGAGAYICGEETSLLSSLEGFRGQPRLKPPFPAVEGLYACPTIVNNVETLMNVPPILEHGAPWFRQWGTEKSPGTKILSVSGPVKRPGNYEVSMGMPLSKLVNDVCGGMLDGHRVKAVIPGGSSVPLLPASMLDTPLDFEAMVEAGTLLGSGGVIVIDEGTCIVDAMYNITRFYEHESCGKCTPCREGTYWMAEVFERLETGKGRAGDVDLLADVSDNILGKSFCALGDAAAMPVLGAIKHFREEFDHHVTHGRCMVNRRKDSLAGAVA
jgi:NADH-quinone oxidoreductase subunit F